jgi:hypothetical protein
MALKFLGDGDADSFQLCGSAVVHTTIVIRTCLVADHGRPVGDPRLLAPHASYSKLDDNKLLISMVRVNKKRLVGDGPAAAFSLIEHRCSSPCMRTE